MPTQFTIGIEEEYQIVDPETRELRSYVQRFLEHGRTVMPDQLHAELMQSQLEAGTRICSNIQEARAEILKMRRAVVDLASIEGLAVAAAGTHPFASWARQEIAPYGRYPELVRFLQDVGRRLLVFGMHVHIGIQDTDLRIQVLNQIRGFLPCLLALTTSSPFWHNRDTGLKSYRSVVFESLPRTGIPPHFDSFRDYQSYVELLLSTGSISEPTHIWWDARPSERFPTLEVRIPDMCTRVDETICVAALVQAIVAKLVRLIKQGEPWPIHRKHLHEENKWRAERYGVKGRLVDFALREEVPLAQVVESLLHWVDDAVDELGSRAEVEYATTILSQGASADRQLAEFHRTNDLHAVVDRIVEETQEGLATC
jgi:carboxylate-amine ligase